MAESRIPRVLLVDDDDEVRDVLRLICELESMEVVGEASNGLEAIQIAINQPVDFVILDYMMPRLDGEATAALLRALCPGTRIVAFSAVLDSKPEWSDSFLNKNRLTEVVPMLEGLLT
jgi:CheY-like chemotaxis protein